MLCACVITFNKAQGKYFVCCNIRRPADKFNSIQFNLFRFPKNPLHGVTHMDIEIVREYIYMYKVLQINVEYRVSLRFDIFIIFIQGST
jgi:hypothetical protein